MAKKILLDEEGTGKRRWQALVIPVVLILLFLLAFVIRSAFYWPPACEPVDTYGDEGYLLSGNDPNYHKRTVDYAQETHTHLVFDPLLDFPKGSPNPNPPLYAWSIAMLGYLISPAFGGDVHTATWYAMEFAAAFWAALTVFPVYVFTRDMFGKKPGILAAFFIAVMAGNVERTPVGFSDHDAFVVFFVVLAFLFMMRALRMLNNKIYVKEWFVARSIAIGTRKLLIENKKAFLYAILAALCVAAVALSWKGVAYIWAIVLVYFAFHLSVKKLKGEEGLGIALVILMAMGLSLVFSFPYYNIKYFTVWFESPFFVFAAMSLLVLLLVPTRDLPWLLVVPIILGLVFGGAYLLQYLFPNVMDTIFSLQGYFLKTKLYETIAEAQAPDFSRMVFSYGVVTFYFALIGAAWAAYRLPAEKWRNDYIVTVVWAIVSIYMAMSAVRFMYNATPVFAIFAGWITYEIIRQTGFGKLVKTLGGLKSDPLHAIRKSVKPRHVFVALFMVFLVIWPNFWFGFDAGVPYEEKREIDKKIYDFYPEQIKPDQEDYDSAGNWYLGSFGTAYPSEYWVDGMFWLAEQDKDEVPEDKPGFISWWDYGHWAVHMGEHPAAADNFQNGFQWAGNYISAQNESIAIALVISKIVEGTMLDDEKSLDILEKYIGEEKREDYIDYYQHPEDYKKEVLDNPHIYGPHDKKRMDRVNIKYLMMSRMLTRTLEQDMLVNLLHDLEMHTGKSLRYFAVDTRLLPVGPRNTGIYYAPIKLSDQRIDDFLVVWAIGNDGSRTSINDEKSMTERYENPDFKVEKYEIEYTEMFYNSMFYRTYVGWQPIDVEINEPGIPTISRPNDVGRTQLQIQAMPPIQGWGMTNHRLEYRTLYWNPHKEDASKHPDKWEVVTQEEAAKYQNWSESDDPNVVEKAGLLDTTYRGLFGGVFFLKYYDGAYINGTVTLDDDTPLPGARITVYDDIELSRPEWPGAPHGYTYTDEEGRYSIIAPYGNVTVRLSNGGQDETGFERTNQLLMQMERRILNDTVIEITDEQAMRIPEDRDDDGIWDFNIRHDIVVNLSTVEGTAFWDLDGDKEFDGDEDEPIVGQVVLDNSSYNRNQTVEIEANGSFIIENVIPDRYDLGYSPEQGGHYKLSDMNVDDDITVAIDLPIVPASLNGTVTDTNNNTIPGAKMLLTELHSTIIYEILTADNGTYELDRLLPGNYTLKVDDVRYSALDILVDIDEGESYTRNVTLADTVKLTGTASLSNGRAAANALLVFRNLADDSLSVNIKVEEDGNIFGHVPPGNYSVNGKVIKDDATYIFMKSLDLVDDIEMDFFFKRAYRTNGTTFDDLNGNHEYDPVVGTLEPGPGASSGPGGPSIPGPATMKEGREDIIVEFFGPDGNISMTVSKDGYYEVYLEKGEYIVHTYSSNFEDKNYSALQTFNVTEDARMDIEIEQGTKFAGTVFYEEILNGILDEGEALPGAKMYFDDGETTLVRYANESGVFALLLPKTTYNITVEVLGYEDYTETIVIKGPDLHKNVILDPKNITFGGLAGYDIDGNGVIDDGEGLEMVITLTAQNISLQEIEVETDADGVFEIDLFPQHYTVKIDLTVETEDGEVRYRYDDEISLSIGDEDHQVEIALDMYFKVFGDIFFDVNEDDILNSGERRMPVLTFYDLDGEGHDADVTPDGYEIYLTPGKYFYYAHEPEGHSASDHSAVLGSIDVSVETGLDIEMTPATRANGVVYFDEDGNLDVDSGEQERDVNITISLLEGEVELARVGTVSNDIGEFSKYLPWEANYSFRISMIEDRSLHNNNYTVRYTYNDTIEATRNQKNLLHDIIVDKSFLVSGSVIYKGPEGDVPLEGAVITYDEFTTTSGTEGLYELYVRPGEYAPTVDMSGFILPESVFGNRTIEYDETEQNFILDPLNVTVEGNVFVDFNGNGIRDAKTEGMRTTVEFLAADDRTINGTVDTDSRGGFIIDLEPGLYYVWIEASSGVRHFVLFDYFGLNASGEVFVVDLELEEGLTLQGEMFFEDTDGTLRTPVGSNITLENNQTGVKRQITVTTRQYALHLPPGIYTLTADHINNEHDMDMDYHLDVQFNLTERKKMNLIFKKEMLYHLDFEWDEDEQTLLPQNSSITYNLTVTNVGNEPASFDLTASPPTGWKAEPSVDEVSLKIGESTDFTVLINVSKDAKAGENSITVRGQPQLPEGEGLDSGLEEFFNTTRLKVDIIQVYTILFEPSDMEPTLHEGVYHYFVDLKNEGNGRDEVKIDLAAPFPGWNITIRDSDPIMNKGQQKQVEVLLEPEDPVNMTGRPLTVRLIAESESGKTAEYELLVAFPDLSATLGVSGPGVKVKKDEGEPSIIRMPTPAFEIVPVVVALALAMLVVHRRRRGGGRP